MVKEINTVIERLQQILTETITNMDRTGTKRERERERNQDRDEQRKTGRESWSNGYGMRLVIEGHGFESQHWMDIFRLICCKNCIDVCLKKTENKRKRERNGNRHMCYRHKQSQDQRDTERWTHTGTERKKKLKSTQWEQCDQIWHSFKSLGQIFEGLFSIWQNFNLTLGRMICYCISFHCRDGHILINNLDIWSH